VDLEVAGGFGEMHLTMANRPNPDNPRSSVVPAMSVIAAIRRDAAAVMIPG